MGQATDLYNQAAPLVYYEVKTEILKNGAVDSTHTQVSFTNQFGVEGSSKPTDYWYLSKDGVDNYQTRLTITHLADQLPMRFTWTYREREITPNPATVHGSFSVTLDLTGSSVTHTYSASGTNRQSARSSNDITATGFFSPI